MRLSSVFSLLLTASLLLAGCTHSGEPEEDPDELGVAGVNDPGPVEAPAARTQVVAQVVQPTQAIGVPGGGGDILILERRGQVHLLQSEASETTLLLDISERVDDKRGRERGLKSAAFHPDFQENGILFLVHDMTLDEDTDGEQNEDREGFGHVTRTFADPQDLAAGLEVGDDLLVIHYPENWFHNTAGIQFGPDGMMYVASGDGGGWRYDAQRTNNLWGSILRLDVDHEQGYTIPADNPFVDDPDVLDEIWLYGFRNPWRFDFHPDTGDLFIANTGEENVESVYRFPADGDAPRNHGWPYYEGNQTLDTHHGEPPQEINFPIVNYPSREQGRCAMIGGAVYQGDAFPGLQGKFVFGDHCSGDLMFAQQVEGEWILTPWFTTDMMIISIDRDDDGELLISGMRGEIHKIVPE